MLFQSGVSAIKPGTKVNLQVFRRGAYKDMTVIVGEFEADKPAGKDAEAPVPARNVLGLTVDDLSDAQKRDLRLKNGVQVIKAEGPSAKSGLREGDVILTVENTEIRDAKQFGALVAKLDKKQRVTLLVRRGEWVNYVIVQPGVR